MRRIHLMTTNKMTSAKKSSDFRDMGISEMNSTHHFEYETSSKQCRIIDFVRYDLIVKSLVVTRWDYIRGSIYSPTTSPKISIIAEVVLVVVRVLLC